MNKLFALFVLCLALVGCSSTPKEKPQAQPTVTVVVVPSQQAAPAPAQVVYTQPQVVYQSAPIYTPPTQVVYERAPVYGGPVYPVVPPNVVYGGYHHSTPITPSISFQYIRR